MLSNAVLVTLLCPFGGIGEVCDPTAHHDAENSHGKAFTGKWAMWPADENA
jgi:hypothetical protein